MDKKWTQQTVAAVNWSTMDEYETLTACLEHWEESGPEDEMDGNTCPACMRWGGLGRRATECSCCPLAGDPATVSNCCAGLYNQRVTCSSKRSHGLVVEHIRKVRDRYHHEQKEFAQDLTIKMLPHLRLSADPTYSGYYYLCPEDDYILEIIPGTSPIRFRIRKRNIQKGLCSKSVELKPGDRVRILYAISEDDKTARIIRKLNSIETNRTILLFNPAWTKYEDGMLGGQNYGVPGYPHSHLWAQQNEIEPLAEKEWEKLGFPQLGDRVQAPGRLLFIENDRVGTVIGIQEKNDVAILFNPSWTSGFEGSSWARVPGYPKSHHCFFLSYVKSWPKG